MLTLITYPAAFGLFSASPFCVKAAYMLHLSGQRWQRSDLLNPGKMPHRKLPVLRAPEGLLPDSDDIRRWLEVQGADFDAGLSDVQKAQSQALCRMVEDHLYFQIVQDRWANDQVWPILRATFFNEIPALIRRPISSAVRKTVLKGLDTQGVARFTQAERMERVEQDLHAISAFLAEAPFLFGAAPTAADLSVAPMLAAMRATPIDTELRLRIANDPLLAGYIDRVDQTVGLQ